MQPKLTKKVENIISKYIDNTAKYPDDFPRAQGLNQLWKKDTAATAVAADNADSARRI